MALTDTQLDALLSCLETQLPGVDFLARVEAQAFGQPQRRGFFASISDVVQELLGLEPYRPIYAGGWRVGSAIAAMLLGFYAGYHIGTTDAQEGENYAIEQEASLI